MTRVINIITINTMIRIISTDTTAVVVVIVFVIVLVIDIVINIIIMTAY